LVDGVIGVANHWRKKLKFVSFFLS
jgi:hypothetical protein